MANKSFNLFDEFAGRSLYSFVSPRRQGTTHMATTDVSKQAILQELEYW